MRVSSKPKGREQWRVVLELLRMLRTFSAEERNQLMVHGHFIESLRSRFQEAP